VKQTGLRYVELHGKVTSLATLAVSRIADSIKYITFPFTFSHSVTAFYNRFLLHT